MALFQRQQQTSNVAQLYTFGQNRTVLLVGLGNVGREYESTRHNLGFICLDNFVSKQDEMSDWLEKKDLKSYISTGRLGDALVIAIKPTTYMNLSGEAVQAASHFYRVTPASTVVIHDELDIPFGQIRLRTGGSSAGHNGIKSITQHIGEEYGRIRIGIGPKAPPEIESADYVLQKLSNVQQTQLSNLTKEVNAILTEYIYSKSLPTETRSFLI